ncbi:MAG: STAS domain-containing protein [Bacteroidetes bacterium]|nr:STAS domain-containing protein [Bacteroidota bacterium]
MEVRRSGEGRTVSVTVAGKMDAYWSDALSRELESCVNDGAREIDLDLSGVSFVSSAGLRVLLIYLKQMGAIKGTLRFVNPSEKVRSIFDLSGLTHLLSTAMGDVGSDDTIPNVPLPDHTGTYVTVLRRDVPPGTVHFHEADEGKPGQSYPQIRYSADRLGFGIGAFGDEGSGVERQFGEYLAAGGITVCVPTDGRAHPDYMIEDGVFVPTITVHSGISLRADFNRQVNFEASEQYRGVPLSSLALLALRESGTPAAAALIVAESAALIGARRTRSPLLDDDPYGVPSVRSHFSFTTEPSYERCTAVICAVFSATPTAMFRPVDPAARCWGHAHAAVFSHRPLPDGVIDASEYIRTLFDYATVHSVLHMMHDARNPMRSAESEFIRGAMWIHPLEAIADRPPSVWDPVSESRDGQAGKPAQVRSSGGGA